uniref:Activating signal cointegrator 1 complex subunit 1 (inferred by orthology to a human protein) n=1 Tax=Anisakis simplex TaxID=6269 RepID=A0A0M3K9Z8_ANISI
LRGGDTVDLYGDDDGTDNCVVDDNGSEDQFDVNNEGNSATYENIESALLTSDQHESSIESDTGVSHEILTDDNHLQLSDSNDTASNYDGSTKNEIKFDTSSRKWSTRMIIPREMIRFIVGVKGSTKRKLENETDCRIVLPDQKSKTQQSIGIISTKSEESVSRCIDRIQLLIMNKRERSAYTHFIAIPLNSTEIQQSFNQFIDLIHNDEQLPNTCRELSVFQAPIKLHITVVMLSLLDKNEIVEATNTLRKHANKCVEEMIRGEGIEVEMRGLEFMNDDPSRVRVLFAKIHSERLQQLVDAIADGFGEVGLAPRRQDRVKIHCTLMNTRYAIEKGIKDNDTMDVRMLMEKYGEFYFGHVTLSEVISKFLLLSSPSGSDMPQVGVIKFNDITKKWSTCVEMPKEMRCFVIGKKGQMKRKLEEETECRLVLPPKKKKLCPISWLFAISSHLIESLHDEHFSMCTLQSRDDFCNCRIGIKS